MDTHSEQQPSVDLPNDIVAHVRAKVASGEYASDIEVICDGLRALDSRGKALETWLAREVVAAYDAMKADPSRGRSPADVRAALAEERGRASAAA